MRVALVIPYNPLLEIGGLELGTLRHAQAMAKRGHTVRIFSLVRSGLINGIEIVGLPNFPKLCAELIDRAGNYDVIHWMEIFPDPGQVTLQAMTSGLLRSLGPLVILMVATSGNLRNRGTGIFITPLIKETIDAYVISNPDQLHEFAESGITVEVHNIGFGIDARHEFFPVSNQEIESLRWNLNLSQDKVLCLFIGRFVARKRPDFLLRAWRQLEHLYDAAQLVIVGSGMGQDDSIESLVQSLARRTKAAIFRDITGRTVDYYRACDVLLLPSDREGQPNVLLEMMACGHPVIGSDIPGIRELLIDGRNGILFNKDDIQAFSRAIENLVRDPIKRTQMGENARVTVLEEKNIDLVTGKYLRMYDRLLQERRKYAAQIASGGNTSL